jgi:DNA-binding phage protein
MDRSWSSSEEDDEEPERPDPVIALARLATPSQEDVAEARALLIDDVQSGERDWRYSADMCHMLERIARSRAMSEVFHDARMERLRLDFAASQAARNERNDAQQALREAFQSDSEDDNFTGFSGQNPNSGTPRPIVYTDRNNLTRRQHHRHQRQHREHQM